MVSNSKMSLMHVYQTTNSTFFLEQIQHPLERDEAANQLMLGTCLRLAANPSGKSPASVMIWVEDDQGLTSAALMTPNNSLLLYCEPLQKISSLNLIIQSLGSTPVKRVLGKNHVVEAFSGLWKNRHGGIVQMNRQERIYKLTEVKGTSFTAGYMRLAVPSDADQLVEWASAFDQEVLGGRDVKFVESRILKMIREGNLFVWEDNLVTTMAAKTRPTHHGTGVSLLYTPPILRGRGYASALVSTLSQQLLRDGYQFCVTSSDLSNPIPNHVFQKIGYRPVCDVEEIQLIG
jgi:uncharacterized protein